MEAEPTPCLFVSDMHGRRDRYEKLLDAIVRERPAAVFLGGDLLPHGFSLAQADQAEDFLADFLWPALRRLRQQLAGDYPRLFAILGNDDPRIEEAALLEAQREELLEYVHQRRVPFGRWDVYGYACVPPTPFSLKDWERYDVSRFVDVGAVSPEEGWRSVPVDPREIRNGTIQDDLRALAGEAELDAAIFLFHSPPYRSALDRAALDGRMHEHAPLDVHVGSIAVRRFLERRGPRVSLHGHVHESARLTGRWMDRIGATVALSAAHDDQELALVRFDPARPQEATRALL